MYRRRTGYNDGVTRAWPILCLLIACGDDRRAAPQVLAPRPPAAAPAMDAAPPVVDGAVAADADRPWPEPRAPQAECSFERRVVCHPGTPTRRALQPAPFEWCARTSPNTTSSDYPVPDAGFSASETRTARATTPDACCYIEFFTHLCD